VRRYEVIVTGAKGFIGRHVCGALEKSGASFLAVSREGTNEVGDLSAETDWSGVLTPMATVVHLAGLAHALDRSSAAEMAGFRRVNLGGTESLARQAAAAGVTRLVFVSSIRVLGLHTNGHGAFGTTDEPAPQEAYAISKWEAEQALWQIAQETGLEVCVIRPPLVYGTGARGNFARLVCLVRSGVPLPFGAVRNRRSMIAVDNLVDLILLCTRHPSAAGQTFLASDGGSLSTPELIRGLATAVGTRTRLLPVPVGLLRAAGRVLGKSAEIDRLVGSLEVDISHTRETLHWSPPISVGEGLRRAVQA
jgi:nucleoside-diphosphate-sugar epimerase